MAYDIYLIQRQLEDCYKHVVRLSEVVKDLISAVTITSKEIIDLRNRIEALEKEKEDDGR